MTTQEKQRTLFVGIDVHKDTHTAVGVSPFGEKLFELTVGNYQKDFDSLSTRIREVESESLLSPYIGLEDCHGYGERIASALYNHGYPMVHVPPILVDHARKRQTHPEKNDSLDALGVAKVMMNSLDSLPAFSIAESDTFAKYLKELSHDRAFLVEECTRLKNQLHLALHRIYNTEYRTYFKNPFSPQALQHWLRIRPVCDPYVLRALKRKVKRMQQLLIEIRELEKDMQTLMDEAGYTLTTASGCGPCLRQVSSAKLEIFIASIVLLLWRSTRDVRRESAHRAKAPAIARREAAIVPSTAPSTAWRSRRFQGPAIRSVCGTGRRKCLKENPRAKR